MRSLIHISPARPTNPAIIPMTEGEREVWNARYAAKGAIGRFVTGLLGIWVFYPFVLTEVYSKILYFALWICSWPLMYKAGVDLVRYFKYVYSLTNRRLVVYDRLRRVKVAEIALIDIERRALHEVVTPFEKTEIWLTPKNPETSQGWPFAHGFDRRVPGISDPPLLYALIGQLRKRALDESFAARGRP